MSDDEDSGPGEKDDEMDAREAVANELFQGDEDEAMEGDEGEAVQPPPKPVDEFGDLDQSEESGIVSLNSSLMEILFHLQKIPLSVWQPLVSRSQCVYMYTFYFKNTEF